jgi:hypothetical protein
MSKGHIVPPFFQRLAEARYRVRRSSPLPIAEELKDFHDRFSLPKKLSSTLIISSLLSQKRLYTTVIPDLIRNPVFLKPGFPLSQE